MSEIANLLGTLVLVVLFVAVVAALTGIFRDE